jgi:hypothetical protein
MEYLASVYLYTICGKYRSFRSEMYWISWYISVRVVPILLRFLWFCCKILELFYLCGIVILNFIIYINWPLSGLELITNTVVSNHFHSVKILLFSSARSRDFDGMLDTGLRCRCTQQAPIDMSHFNVLSST